MSLDTEFDFILMYLKELVRTSQKSIIALEPHLDPFNKDSQSSNRDKEVESTAVPIHQAIEERNGFGNNLNNQILNSAWK